MTERSTSARIEVHPSVLFRLGQDLITDEFQAVAELVKNSYDADANWAIVRIVTTQGPDQFPDDDGYVEIIDDGHGMTIDDLHRGWLTISNSTKSHMKRLGKTTDRGRTPLGDKGLGRLGTQRLGNRLTIVTTPSKGSITHELSLDWRSLAEYEALSHVAVLIRSTATTSRPGTKIIVSDLHDVKRLTDVASVERELARIISPYRGVMGFSLRGTVNGSRLDLEGLESRLRRAAVIHYDLVYDEDELIMSGRMRLNHLRPNTRKDRPLFDEICEEDSGNALRQFLQTKSLSKDLCLRRATTEGWWIEFERTLRLAELEPILIESDTGSDNGALGWSSGPAKADQGTVASPGPFIGEIDGFNLSAGSAERVQGFDSLADLRAQINALSGIQIYRDGFNIRTEDDWIGLSKHWTSGSSWYGLRPGTTLGYIELSARDNAQLTETTDREGFNLTPHFRNFRKIMAEFVKSSHEIQEFIGRSWVEFRRSLSEASEDGTVGSPRELTDRLGKTLSEAHEHRASLERARTELAEGQQATEKIAERLTTSAADPGSEGEELVGPLQDIGQHLATVLNVIKDMETYVRGLESQQTVGDRLLDELDSLEEQIVLGYETMGVGLIAESLAHEISNISDRLLQQANRIATYVGQHHPTDRRMVVFVDHVRGTVTALRRQVSHLSPMLRYVREQREVIALSELLNDVESYFNARWESENVSVRLDVIRDGTVRMNRGKLLQVFDNLLLNSEYWLRQDIRLQRLERGEITVCVNGTRVQVSDNGRGVDPQIEHALFEPFTTRKPSGRGLGLYICARLLEADGCSIALLQDRNDRGHRYIFSVDLSGVQIR